MLLSSHLHAQCNGSLTYEARDQVGSYSTGSSKAAVVIGTYVCSACNKVVHWYNWCGRFAQMDSPLHLECCVCPVQSEHACLIRYVSCAARHCTDRCALDMSVGRIKYVLLQLVKCLASQVTVKDNA
jgi:hypothetical protein